MWISGFDEAFATPTKKASRLALRTMQILAEETGVRSTIDPLGGGYFIEHLTEVMVNQIREHVAEVDEQGGAVAAIDSGFLRKRMLENDLRWAAEREAGTRPIVAHNIYRSEGHEEHEVEFQRFRPDIQADQLHRLASIREKRDNAAVANRLEAVQRSAAAGGNVMPSIVAAVREYATVGELMSALYAECGEWQERAI